MRWWTGCVREHPRPNGFAACIRTTCATLTEAGVFRLAMPTDVGGYQADEDIVAEVLAQISRGCPSTGWMCTIMLISNVIPALPGR